MNSLRSAAGRIARVALARSRSRLAGVFPSYADALGACGGRGYEDSRLLDLVSEKTSRYAVALSASDAAPECDEPALMLYAAMQAATRMQKTATVVDCGGAFGAHYYLLRKLMPEMAELRWGVVETAAMADAARRSVSDPGLLFYDSLSAAVLQLGAPNLVYANNALQYCPEPLATVAALLRLDASFVCLAKVAVAEVDEVFFTTQESMLSENGPGSVWRGFADSKVRYPLAIIPGGAVQELLAPRYRLSLRYVHPARLHHPHCGLIEYHSFLAARRTAAAIGDAS